MSASGPDAIEPTRSRMPTAPLSASARDTCAPRRLRARPSPRRRVRRRTAEVIGSSCMRADPVPRLGESSRLRDSASVDAPGGTRCRIRASRQVISRRGVGAGTRDGGHARRLLKAADQRGARFGRAPPASAALARAATMIKPSCAAESRQMELEGLAVAVTRDLRRASDDPRHAPGCRNSRSCGCPSQRKPKPWAASAKRTNAASRRAQRRRTTARVGGIARGASGSLQDARSHACAALHAAAGASCDGPDEPIAAANALPRAPRTEPAVRRGMTDSWCRARAPGHRGAIRAGDLSARARVLRYMPQGYTNKQLSCACDGGVNVKKAVQT